MCLIVYDIGIAIGLRTLVCLEAYRAYLYWGKAVQFVRDVSVCEKGRHHKAVYSTQALNGHPCITARYSEPITFVLYITRLEWYMQFYFTTKWAIKWGSSINNVDLWHQSVCYLPNKRMIFHLSEFTFVRVLGSANPSPIGSRERRH